MHVLSADQIKINCSAQILFYLINLSGSVNRKIKSGSPKTYQIYVRVPMTHMMILILYFSWFIDAMY